MLIFLHVSITGPQCKQLRFYGLYTKFTFHYVVLEKTSTEPQCCTTTIPLNGQMSRQPLLHVLYLQVS